MRRLIDRLRHPGETADMRAYRRWRDTTGRGEPYRIPSTVREGEPWPQMARSQRTVETVSWGHERLSEEQPRPDISMIIGARIISIERRRQAEEED
jgi:hypothetical protein